MLKLIIDRLWQSVVVLLVVSALTFGLLAAAGGDAVSELASNPKIPPAALAEMRRVYGLDAPAPTRYARWLADFSRGRLGHSFYFHAPVASILLPRLLRTLLLSVVALALAWSASLALGIQAARRPRRGRATCRRRGRGPRARARCAASRPSAG